MEEKKLREPQNEEERKIVEDYKRFAEKCPNLIAQTQKKKAYDEQLEIYLKEVNRTLKKSLKKIQNDENKKDIDNLSELLKNFMGSTLSLMQMILLKTSTIENYMASVSAILQIGYENTIDGASEKEFHEYMKEEAKKKQEI